MYEERQSVKAGDESEAPPTREPVVGDILIDHVQAQWSTVRIHAILRDIHFVTYV